MMTSTRFQTRRHSPLPGAASQIPVAGLAAGIFFISVDYIRVCLPHPPPEPLLFYPSFGLLFPGLGIAAGMVIVGLRRLVRRIAGMTSRRYRLPAESAVWVILAGIPLYLLGEKLFSGAGISRWHYASYGPLITLLSGSVVVFTAAFWEGRLDGTFRTARGAGGIFLLFPHLVLLTCVVYADNCWYPRTYGYIHTILWCIAAYLVIRMVLLLNTPVENAGGKSIILPIMFSVLLMGGVFPAVKNLGEFNNLRLWMLRHRSYTSRLILWSVARGWIRVPRFPFRAEGSPVPPSGTPAGIDSDYSHRFLRGKNLLLITVDALRADEVTPDNMPFVFSLSSRVYRFTHTYAHGSSTASSFPVIFTSRLKSGRDTPTLADMFSSRGYQTYAVIQETPVRFLMLKRGFKLLKGFKNISELKDIGESVDYSKWGWGIASLTSRDLTERAEKVLTSLDKQPYFLWIHYFDLHQWSSIDNREITGLAPDVPGPLSSRNPERYHCIAHFIDRQIEHLLETLHSAGLNDSTIVVITADHGEGLGDKGIEHHTNYVYDCLVHVPLLILIPGTPGGTIDDACGLADILPTLAGAMAGVSELAADGVSLIPLMEGHPLPKPHPPIWINDGGEQIGLIEYPWKLIFSHRYGIFEMYNIDTDPGETTNLFGIDPHRDDRMIRMTGEYYRRYFWADNMPDAQMK